MEYFIHKVEAEEKLKDIAKTKILQSICYTELVYQRINKKLGYNYSKQQIELFLYQILADTPDTCFEEKGKNFYVRNIEKQIRVTINSNTFRIITVDKLK